MDKKKKIILIISITVIALILMVGGTIAYFGWATTEEETALVDVTVSSGTGSCTLLSDNNIEVFPTSSKYRSRKIKLNAKQEMAAKAYITWNLVVNKIEGLQDESFNYELINNTTGESYGSGNFKDISSGSTITFSNDTEVLGYNIDYEFTLYLWIDGENFNNNYLTMADQELDINMNCNITGTDEGTVVEQNILMSYSDSQSSSSEFLRSGLTRSQIGSITFLDTNEVPSDDNIKSSDASKNSDESIVLWYYNETNEDGLYDVYIGSKGGKIYLESGYYLFSSLQNVKSLDLSSFNTLKVESMYGMFRDCSSLTSLDLSNFDTSNVTTMYAMFYNCSSLTSLDVNNIDTSKVTDMSYMFNKCSSLTSLNLSSFDTSNVTTMVGMFNECSALTALNVGNWNTENVTDMQHMFHYCSSLTSLNLSSFNTSKVESMYSMFSDCSSLTSLNLSSFNTSNATDMSFMFARCYDLSILDVSSFDTSNVTSMYAMFYFCSSLTSLDLSSFDTSNVTSMHGMFYDANKLATIYISELWDISNVTESAGMFYSCYSLLGSSGTTYNSSYIDATYARIDGGTDKPGYLTEKTS